MQYTHESSCLDVISWILFKFIQCKSNILFFKTSKWSSKNFTQITVTLFLHSWICNTLTLLEVLRSWFDGSEWAVQVTLMTWHLFLYWKWYVGLYLPVIILGLSSLVFSTLWYVSGSRAFVEHRVACREQLPAVPIIHRNVVFCL